LANKTVSWFERIIVSDRSPSFVAVEGERVLGFAQLNIDGRVALLYVAPEARFRGISRAMLKALEERGIQLGMERLYLESTKTAARFYEACGYRRTGGLQVGFAGLEAWPMEKMLNEPGENKTSIRYLSFDHVQLAIPVGGEDRAREFYGSVLGMTEVPKPTVLAARGGVWFDAGAVRIHLGIEPDYQPSKKAHPAIVVQDLASLRQRLEQGGCVVRDGEELEGRLRLHTEDPFGNRLEFVELVSS
jgi:catechol 2,3-dioxygenase-like lactoylglutathione lyase family enzyme